jgi:hypothetical protein
VFGSVLGVAVLRVRCCGCSLTLSSNAESGVELPDEGKRSPALSTGIVTVVTLRVQLEGASHVLKMWGRWKGCSSLTCSGAMR